MVEIILHGSVMINTSNLYYFYYWVFLYIYIYMKKKGILYFWLFAQFSFWNRTIQLMAMGCLHWVLQKTHVTTINRDAQKPLWTENWSSVCLFGIPAWSPYYLECQKWLSMCFTVGPTATLPIICVSITVIWKMHIFPCDIDPWPKQWICNDLKRTNLCCLNAL